MGAGGGVLGGLGLHDLDMVMARSKITPLRRGNLFVCAKVVVVLGIFDGREGIILAKVLAVKKSLSVLCLGGASLAYLSPNKVSLCLLSSDKNKPKHFLSLYSITLWSGPNTFLNRQWYLPRIS